MRKAIKGEWVENGRRKTTWNEYDEWITEVETIIKTVHRLNNKPKGK
jgi:hypothetical protein